MAGDIKVDPFESAFLDSFAGKNVNRDNLNATSRDNVRDRRARAFVTAMWHERKRHGNTSTNRHQVLSRVHVRSGFCVWTLR